MKRIALYAMLTMALTVGNGFSASFTLSPQFSTETSYTDNLFLSEGNKVEEFITVLSFGLTASIYEKTAGLEFSYNPEYAIYGKYDENNTLRHAAALIAWKDFDKHTRLEFVNRFLLTEDPLGEEDLVRNDAVVVPGDYTARTSRQEYYRNTSILSLTRQFGKNDLFRAGFLYSFLENDDPSVSDNRRYEPSLELSHMVSKDYSIDIIGVYTRGEFDRESSRLLDSESEDDFDNWTGSIRLERFLSRHSSLFAQYTHIYRDYDEDRENDAETVSNRDYQVYQPMAGYSIQGKDDLSASLSLGYYYLDEDHGDSQDGMFVAADVTKSWKYRRGAATLLAKSGIDQEDFGAESLGLRKYVFLRLSALHRFYRNFSGEVFGDARYSDTVGDSETDVEKQIRWTFGAGLNYQAYRWLFFDLDYKFARFDSDSDDELEEKDYDENSVIFTITLKPEIPWRL